MKKIFGILLLALVMIFTYSCEEEKDDEANNNSGTTGCTGILSSTASGYFAANYCFATLYNYSVTDTTLNITINGTVDGVEVSVNISIGDWGRPNFSGPGTYYCGMNNEAGFFEVIYHGTNNEFYKSTAGWVAIGQYDGNSCQGNFNVTTEGYYSQKNVAYTGTFAF